MGSKYELFLGALAVWRVTHLLNAEDGPGNILVNFRKWVGSGFWADLLDCFYCLSLWVAVPFAFLVGGTRKELLLVWLALSGAAILLERLKPGMPDHGEVSYHKEAEINASDTGGEP